MLKYFYAGRKKLKSILSTVMVNRMMLADREDRAAFRSKEYEQEHGYTLRVQQGRISQKNTEVAGN